MLAFARRSSMSGTWTALRARLSRWLPEHGRAAEWHSFFQAWRRDPRSVGAMAPSSRALARAITAPVLPDAGPVLELGCGTGVFTRALLARGVPEHQLQLVERDAELAQQLRRRFPAAQVLEGDAAARRPHSIWAGVDRAPAAIVCGLPLLNMGFRQQMRVMQGAFSVLRPGGALLLFTYGVRVPLRPAVLHRLGLKATRLETVVANVPPAHVWRVRRRARHGAARPR